MEPQPEPEPDPPNPAKKTMTLISNILFWLVCISLVGGSSIFALSNNPNKSYFGFRFYSVLTQSMSPKADGSSPPGGFYKGDIIIVKLSEPEEIAAGDIITFNPNMRDTEGKAYLTHRVVEVLNEMDGEEGIYFITKGDFNDSEDPPISGHMLIGKKVFTIPKMGSVLQLLRDNFILALVTIVCLFGCIIMLKWYFAKPKEEEEIVQTA